jgi:hypothetical protein
LRNRTPFDYVTANNNPIEVRPMLLEVPARLEALKNSGIQGWKQPILEYLRANNHSYDSVFKKYP